MSQDTTLLAFSPGGYQFLKGGFPYSRGVVAAPGFAIEHARFRSPLPLGDGFAAVERHLAGMGRPRQSLCAMELRSPQPFTFEGFREFNKGYVAVLEDWQIVRDGLNPMARTNVSPAVGAPAEPSLYGFSYTVPAAEAGSFVVSGGGEWPEGSRDPMDVIRRGETSPDAIEGKARFVIGLMEQRLEGLGVSWRQATVVQVYTVYDIHPFLERELSARTRTPHGFVWHYARPPIVTIEYEMDVRGCRSEVVIG